MKGGFVRADELLHRTQHTKEQYELTNIAIALYQRRWKSNPVRKAPLKRVRVWIEQLHNSCVIVPHYGFLTSVCGVD